MKLDDLQDKQWETHLHNFYMRSWNFICDGKTTILEPIWLNIPEKQQFYSKTDKKMLFLGPTWTMYLISEQKDEKNRLMVYAPYLFQQGQVFLVPAELIVKIGYN
jgi:hypothetical protein